MAHLHQPTPEVVIHFDIKSPNCLLAEGLGRAKIADAGGASDAVDVIAGLNPNPQTLQ